MCVPIAGVIRPITENSFSQAPSVQDDWQTCRQDVYWEAHSVDMR